MREQQCEMIEKTKALLAELEQKIMQREGAAVERQADSVDALSTKVTALTTIAETQSLSTQRLEAQLEEIRTQTNHRFEELLAQLQHPPDL